MSGVCSDTHTPIHTNTKLNALALTSAFNYPCLCLTGAALITVVYRELLHLATVEKILTLIKKEEVHRKSF